MSTYRINGIKYNPANWAGLDPAERAACNRFAAARERELNTITATAWTCQGGPFAGHPVELESTTDRTAPMNVGAWAGHYELQTDPEHIKNHSRPSVASQAPRVLVWVGNDGGKAINTHHHTTTDQKKAGAEVTARGFDQLRDLLADLAEDPTERETTTTSDAGPTKPRTRYTIGRTAYTIEATAEAADRLRSRILKAKRWFSDKLLNAPAPAPVEHDEAAPGAPAIIAAAVAIGTAQAQAATSTAPVPSLFGANNGRNSAPMATLDGFKPGDTVQVNPAARTFGCGVVELLYIRNISGMDCHLARLVRTDGKRLDVQTFDLQHIDTDTADESAELVTCDGPELVDTAAAVADTPQAGCDAIGADHTPTEAAPADYSDPLKTRAQAGGYTEPRETLRADFLRATETGHTQQAGSKRGAWSAVMFRTADGRAGLAFKRPGQPVELVDHATGGDRMRALQAMAQAAEQAHQHAGAAQAAAPAAQQPTDCTQAPETLDDCEDLSLGATLAELEQVAQRWTPEQCRQQADRLEQLNDHGGALAWRCMAAGALDLAQRVTAINAAHNKAGHLTPTPASQRDAIAAQLRERLAQDCTQAHETPAAEPEAPAFQRARPQHIDLRHFLAGGVKPAQLVGLGVHYTGDMANAAGEGAIVEAQADDARGVRVAVTLQDGRHMTHLDGASFSDRPGSRFALNAKVHGAPYLAELAAARAALVASTEAAKTSKAQHHAAELVRLAAEFPHLERAESRHAGGKLAARNMRTMLKAAFPGQKFSVTSDYNCVRVRWVDGPTDAAVTAIIGRFDIGRADYNTDYFYTESSAWSELFGGVQYLFTERDESPELLARALAVFNEKYGKQATPDDWKRATGPFDYRHRDSQGMQHWFREILNATDATPPAKTTRKGAKA